MDQTMEAPWRLKEVAERSQTWDIEYLGDVTNRCQNHTRRLFEGLLLFGGALGSNTRRQVASKVTNEYWPRSGIGGIPHGTRDFVVRFTLCTVSWQ